MALQLSGCMDVLRLPICLPILDHVYMDSSPASHQLGKAVEFIKTTWRDSPGSIQAAAKIMLGIGTVLIFVGTFGDISGMWESAPFWTNLLSSFAGFLFAVPVGVVILYQVTAIRATAHQHK